MSETRQYRKKPVVVEAVQLTAADFNWQAGWDGLPFRPLPQWVVDAVESGALVPGTPHNTDYSQWRVTTLEGEHWGSPGDWLIRGVAGELYFCKPDIFAETYEPAAPSTGTGPEPVAKVDGAQDYRSGKTRIYVTALLEPAEAWREIVESGGYLYAAPPSGSEPDAEMVERVAEAMYEEWWMGRLSQSKVYEPMWHESGDDCRRNYLARAARALSPKEVAADG